MFLRLVYAVGAVGMFAGAIVVAPPMPEPHPIACGVALVVAFYFGRAALTGKDWMP